MAVQVSESPRKRPTQERAQATVDAIVLAAAHLLKTEGSERLTTNRIAEVAGVSIGSLYQYFPNKHAVVAELRARHTEWFEKTLRSEAARRSSASLREGVRPAIERLIAMHRIDPVLHRALAPGDRALSAEGEREYRAVLRDFLVAKAPQLRPLDPETVSYIAVRALEAVIHATALEAPERLEDPEFTREVTELLVRYVEP